MNWRRTTVGLLTSAALVALVAVAWAAGSRFTDDNGNVHEDNIELIAIEAITLGCDQSGTLYCPADNVTRGQMAAFIVRALGLVNTNTGNVFTDDDGSVFEDDIEALQAAGITFGCNQAGTLFCPADNVTRGQMAGFLVRAFNYNDPGAGDFFTDDDGSVFEDEIDKLRVAEITLGCNAQGTLFCPNDPIRRDQMASFLARALKLGNITPPPPPPPTSDGTTSPTTTTTTAPTTTTTVPDNGFTWQINAVASGDQLGTDNDMVVVGGQASISTRADFTNSPAYIRCANISCTSVSALVSLTGGGPSGQHTSLVVIDNQPVIASHAISADDLRVDVCADLLCSSFTTETPLTEEQGQAPSMVAIGDLPVIVSVDIGGTLRLIACDDTDCTTFTDRQLATNVGENAETAMHVVSGLPAIAYWHQGREDVVYILCLDATCSDHVTNTVDGVGRDVGRGIDLTTIGGLPVMTYQNATDDALMLARCVDFECSGTPSINAIDGISDVGLHTSVVAGPDGYAWVAYYDTLNTALKFADCENSTCSVNEVETVDGTVDDVGEYVVLVNLDNQPLMAYRDFTNDRLKTAYGS